MSKGIGGPTPISTTSRGKASDKRLEREKRNQEKAKRRNVKNLVVGLRKLKSDGVKIEPAGL
jgi:hypothetical protein